MNILFTCAGRRNYLLKYFREELDGKGRIFAVDMTTTAPALQEADQWFVVPALTDESYIPTILEICKRENIQLVVSLNDVELPLLTEHREEFEQVGAELLISSEEVIDICFDKLRTVDFLRQNNFNYPKTFTDLFEARQSIEKGDVKFPLFVKPRWGSASMQIFSVSSDEEMQAAYTLAKIQLQKTFLRVSQDVLDKSILIQEGLPGDEYGIDVLNNLNGEVCSVYVKRKLGMRAGETEKSELVENSVLTEVGEKIGAALRHIGNLDCDIFYDGNAVSVLELNPRFGGGYPFSHTLGANYPNAILHWYRKNTFIEKKFTKKTGQIVCKHDNIIVIQT